MDFPIDFVVDWVDGSDPKWISKRSQYQKNKNTDEVRFRDWGFLPFWFRAVEKNAPWVNKIFLIPRLHILAHIRLTKVFLNF